MHGLLFALSVHMNDDDAGPARGGVQPSKSGFMRDGFGGRLARSADDLEAIGMIGKPLDPSTLDEGADDPVPVPPRYIAEVIRDLLKRRRGAVFIGMSDDEVERLFLSAGQHV